ncbi:hypothetical protein KL918_003048 [Ogataea parapolymorpha]|nr:hypothetical protein KL918_003048 [Ogataea parapolymorpha]KAG7871183.1 hypothetical protein KL916_004182 [Ogataea parapolymorpha]
MLVFQKKNTTYRIPPTSNGRYVFGEFHTSPASVKPTTTSVVALISSNEPTASRLATFSPVGGIFLMKKKPSTASTNITPPPDGTIAAAATPCSVLNTISAVRLSTAPQSSEKSANKTELQMYKLAWPMMSPMRPETAMNPENATAYADKIHDALEYVVSKWRCISDMLEMVAVTLTRSKAQPTSTISSTKSLFWCSTWRAVFINFVTEF